MDYKNSFSLITAYEFLNKNNLEVESEEIKNSSDSFKSYSSTLRRAKIIELVKDKAVLVDFLKEVWPSGQTEKGGSRLKFFENLAIRFREDQEGLTAEDDIDDETKYQSEFAYEKDLQKYLIKNLSVIERGLTLYEDGNVIGEEYTIPNTSRRIDILAIDRNNTFVVIELKVSRGYEKVVGQTLFYQSSIKTIFNQKRVRAIIIAREISTELRTATKYIDDFELFEYQLSLTLDKIG